MGWFKGAVAGLALLGLSLSLEAVEAPDFSVTTLGGETVQLSDFRGQKVLLDFWASWCPPCRRELVEINEMLGDHPQGDGFVILAVSVDNTEDEARQYIDQMGYESFTVAWDEGGEVASQYGVRGIPSLFLVDEDGDISWSQVGAVGRETLEEVLEIK